MNSKKIILGLAIIGGVLFSANATQIIDLDDQETTKVDKRKLKVPPKG